MTQKKSKIYGVKTRYILFLLLLGSMPLMAVLTLNITSKTGTKTPFPMVNVKTLTFTGGNLTVTKKDATTNSFALTSMGYLNFSDMILTALAPDTEKSILKIYPNPVRDVLNIDFQLSNKQYDQIEIIDINGKVVFSKQINSCTNSISVSTFPKGMYLCRLQNSTLTTSIKFIKQ